MRQSHDKKDGGSAKALVLNRLLHQARLIRKNGKPALASEAAAFEIEFEKQLAEEGVKAA